MRQREHRGIKRHRQATLLGIDISFSRCISESQRSLHCLNVRYQCFLVIIGNVCQAAGRFIFTMLHLNSGFQSVLSFILILQCNIAHVWHLVYCSSLEWHKHIILICLQKLIRRRHHIISVSQSDGIFRELARQVFLFIERIFHFRHILGTMIFETVSIIPLKE